MKSLIVFVCFMFVLQTINCSPSSDRGCIYAGGRCVSECEEGTHGYSTGCGFLTPEATCENPKPEQDTRGTICDYSACYCDPPTVRDTKTNKCVKLEDCS